MPEVCNWCGGLTNSEELPAATVRDGYLCECHEWEAYDHYPRNGGLCNYCAVCAQCLHDLPFESIHDPCPSKQ